MDATLTLETAKKLVRQKEAAREHRQELQGANTGNMDSTKKVSTWKSKKRLNAKASKVSPQDSKGGAGGRRNKPNQSCMHCGKQRHRSLD